MPKIKNIIIFVSIAAAFVLIYIFFIKKTPETSTLVSSSAPLVQNTTNVIDQNSSVTEEFLSSLLNVNNIKLNDAILFDDAFISLHDSSIVLIPDGNEGRPNPFAPLGVDNIATPIVNPSTVIPPAAPNITTPPATTMPPASTTPPVNPIKP